MILIQEHGRMKLAEVQDDVSQVVMNNLVLPEGRR